MTKKKLEAQTLTQCMDDLYLHVPPKKLPSFVGKYMLYNARHFSTWATALRQKQPDGKMEGFMIFMPNKHMENT